MTLPVGIYHSSTLRNTGPRRRLNHPPVSLEQQQEFAGSVQGPSWHKRLRFLLFFSFAKQETKGSGLRYSGCGRSRGRPHFFLHPRKSPPHFPSHKCPGMHRKGVMADDVSRSSACKCRKGEAERSSSRRYFRIFVFFPPEKREQLCFAPIGTLPGFWQACHLGRLFRQMAESFLRDRNENPGSSEHDRDPAKHRRDA